MYQNYHQNGNYFDISYESLATAKDMARLNSAITRSVVDVLNKLTGEVLATYDGGLIIYEVAPIMWNCPVCDLTCPYCTRDGHCKLDNPMDECDEWAE